MWITEASDAAALQVFKAAELRGQSVTIALTRQVLAELADQPRYCDAVRKVNPERVFRVASAWVTGISRAHLRGHHQGG